MNCEQCGGLVLATKTGRLYCRKCIIAAAVAKGACGNGHPITEKSIMLRTDNYARMICRQCDNESKIRRNPNCLKCGNPYQTGSNGRRYCGTCVSARGKAKRQRSRVQQRWFDWVVVQRVIDGGGVAPGRKLTESEWLAVIDRIGHLNSQELARRGHASPRTVERMRQLHNLKKAKAA